MKPLLAKAIIYLATIVPLRYRQRLGSFLGFLFAYIPTRENTIAALQLELFAKKFGGRTLLPSVYKNLGQTLLETFDLTPVLKSETAISCNDKKLLKELLNSQSGIVALSAHTGNWELLAAYIVRRGFSLTTFGRQARTSLFQMILSELRIRYGVTTIWRTGRSTIKEIRKTLENGEVIAALIDQDTRVSSKLIAFLGTPARTPETLVALAKKAGAKIVSAFLFRNNDNTFTIFLEEIDSSLSVEEILKQYSTNLEGALAHYPSQWVWFHKRWRSLPNGQTLRTNDYLNYLREKIAHRS